MVFTILVATEVLLAYLIPSFVFLAIGTVVAFLIRYKKCPSDKVMVIYGRIGASKEGKRSSRCIHGGAAFIWPVIQDYAYLDLTPITIDIDLRGALSKENIRIDVPSTFTVGISTDAGIMENASERLLGLPNPEIRRIAEDIIFGQTRVVVATMEIQEIISNRDKFVDNIMNGVEVELKKIGLRLINVNIKDITDESGYIAALGKEAAAQAINNAKKAVAERDRDGEVGKAQAEQQQRTEVAAANAKAVEGENTAQISIAESNADRQIKEAEANKRSTAAEKVQLAKALQEAYAAEKTAEMERAERERATQHANVIIPSEIDKQKAQIEADAVAERYRREAQGEADAMYSKLEAQARGNRDLLQKQAEGLQSIVQAAGGEAKLAALLMITDKLPEIVETQVEAVKNLKFDKITVWDNGGSSDGTPTTAKFASGLIQSLPPLQNVFEMAGMKLPDLLDVTPNEEGKESAASSKTKKAEEKAEEKPKRGRKKKTETTA